MFLTLIEITKGLGLLTLISLGYIFLLSYTEAQLNKPVRDAVIGLMFGLLIAIVMIDPIKLSEGATFDPRGGPAILAGVFAGPIGAIIAAVIGSWVRWSVVGGPVALGGIVGFALYALVGIIAGFVIKKFNLKVGIFTLLFFGFVGTLFVTPAFFVSADFDTAISILKKAGPILLLNNLLSTLIIGSFIIYAKQWTEIRGRLRHEEIENARLALIARDTTNGVIITDSDGLTEWANEGFVRISGYSLEEMIGKSPGEVLQGIDTNPDTIKIMSDQIKKIDSFDVEVLNYHKSGKPYWLQIYCQPFVDPDGQQKFMAIEADITERKEIDDLKSNFVSMVSHELRTPLTSIMGSIGLVHSGAVGPLSQKITDLMTIAKTNTERLIGLVNDILDFEKLNSGGMDFNFKKIDICECLIESVERNKSYANGFDVQLELEIPQDGIPVKGDKERLIQVVTNFISNAVKFSPKGETVTVSVSKNGFFHRVEVIDHGTGIPEGFRDKVFEKFSQAETGNLRTVQGTGLGLSISKGIIESHGGTIGFDPKVSVGAKFYFDLPATIK
jgi:PAS domain S-box-containing protein